MHAYLAALAASLQVVACASIPTTPIKNVSLEADSDRWPNGLHLAVDYYPSQWPEWMWESDVARMRESNISVVRVNEFDWTVLEPSEGEYNFTVLDRPLNYLPNTISRLSLAHQLLHLPIGLQRSMISTLSTEPTPPLDLALADTIASPPSTIASTARRSPASSLSGTATHQPLLAGSWTTSLAATIPLEVTTRTLSPGSDLGCRINILLSKR